MDDPDGRVHGLGRDHRPRPAAGPRAAPPALGGDAAMRGRLPPRHVRPRRADAAAPAPRRSRARGGVAGRPRRRSTADRVLVARRPTARRVRAEYLYGSYSNGRDLPDDPAPARGARTRLRGRARLGARSPAAACCSMNGSDHQPPQPWLGQVVAAANELQDDYRFVDHLARASTSPDQPADGLPHLARRAAFRGPRQRADGRRVEPGRRAPGCAAARAGARTPGRAAAARCSSPMGDYPGALLGIGLARSSCSTARTTRRARAAHDEVVEAVRVRYQEARHVGEALTRDALRRPRDRGRRATVSTIVVNPAARRAARSGGGAAPRRGARYTWWRSTTAPPARPRSCARTAGEGDLDHGRRAEDPLGARDDARPRARRRPHRVGRAATPRRRHGGVHLPRRRRPAIAELDLEATREELLALGEAGETISIRQRRAPVREVVVAADPVPGFGWRTYRAVEGQGPAAPRCTPTV